MPGGVGGRGGVADGGDVGSAGARPDGRAGPRRCHGHLQRRRQAPLRPPRRRLQPAGHAGSRWAGRARTRSPRPCSPRPTRCYTARARPAARRDRPGQGVGAGGGAAGGGMGARTPTCASAGAAGAGDRRRRRLRPGAAVASVADDLADAEIVVTQQAPRDWTASSRAPSRCSTAGCRASPSTPTAPCTPR